jgi:asparagine synthase (glutamine-hydrolysing)
MSAALLQSADWHLSLAAERAGMTCELARIEASPMAQRCLDLPRMRHLIEHLPAEGFERRDVFAPWHLALTRGLSVGHFIRRFDPDAAVN